MPRKSSYLVIVNGEQSSTFDTKRKAEDYVKSLNQYTEGNLPDEVTIVKRTVEEKLLKVFKRKKIEILTCEDFLGDFDLINEGERHEA